MRTLARVTSSRIGRWLVIGFVCFFVCGRLPSQHDLLVRIANSWTTRFTEARLSGPFAYRSFARHANNDVHLRLLKAADELNRKGDTRNAAVALLLIGRASDARAILREALISSTGEADIIEAMRRSRDRALLNDFSAALLTGGTADRELLIAFESADRAYRLGPSQETAWNRSLAIERLGFAALAARAWRIATADPEAAWSREANERRAAAMREASAAAPPSEELFFQRELIERATSIAEGAPSIHAVLQEGAEREAKFGDSLASDTARWLLQQMSSGREKDRELVLTGLRSYARGRAAFEADRLDQALTAFRAAETDLHALHSPLEWLALDQRIRCQCWNREPTCLASLQNLRADLERSGRYPWLSARTAYAVGQTLFRQGRIYEAAELLTIAQSGLRRTNDKAGEAMMDSLLANVLAMAGETDLALHHYLAGLRQPAPAIGDRHRRQLGDFEAFLLQHRFIATTELVLDELDRWPATDEGRVKAATLRGIIAARREDPSAASMYFRQAHARLAAVADSTVRADAGNALAVAEAGARSGPRSAVLAQLNAAITRHEQFESSVLLPQLLVQRGALLEARHEHARAEADYLRAMQLVELRGPRVDRMLIGFGLAAEQESPFDRAIRLMLNTGRPAAALQTAERAMALRISNLYASSAGLRDPFHHGTSEFHGDALATARSFLRSSDVIVVQHLLRDELVSWILTASELEVVRVPLPAAEMLYRIERFTACTARGDCRDEEGLEYASNVLLRPWIERVPRNVTVIISPPADLKSVPFPMLSTRRHEPLISRNPIATTPGLRAYVRAMRNDATRSGTSRAFFAAAPHPGGSRDALPLAASEVQTAARSYNDSIVDPAATRTRFLEEASSSCVVHFAGHAVVNEAQPLLSALVFQPGDRQLLYVHELEQRWFSNTRLMVLSACETGVAPVPTMSIAHALLEQGIPSVVYTSWPVEDELSFEFAVAFHRAIAAGSSRAEALRQAELSLAAKYPNRPDIWAAFGISGAPVPLTQRESGGRQ